MIQDRPHREVAVVAGLPVLQPCTLFECVDAWLNTWFIDAAYAHHTINPDVAGRWFAAQPLDKS